MKRFLASLCVVLVLVMSFSVVAFAGDTVLIEGVSPEDGAKGLQPQNMAVKVKFSDNMIDNEANIAANSTKFVLKNAAGKVIGSEITYSPKYPNELWVIMTEDLESDTDYTFTVYPGVVSADGRVTDTEYTSTFHTRNVKTDTTISMVLTMAMMGFMFFFTARATKKAAMKDDPVATQKELLKKMNPYKLSKEKGISLDEAKAMIAKEQEKLKKLEAKALEEQAKRQAIKEAEMKRIEAEMIAAEEAARHANNFQVKKAGSLNAHGIATPKAVVKANKAKREAAAKAAKKAAKK